MDVASRSTAPLSSTNIPSTLYLSTCTIPYHGIVGFYGTKRLDHGHGRQRHVTSTMVSYYQLVSYDHRSILSPDNLNRRHRIAQFYKFILVEFYDDHYQESTRYITALHIVLLCRRDSQKSVHARDVYDGTWTHTQQWRSYKSISDAAADKTQRRVLEKKWRSKVDEYTPHLWGNFKTHKADLSTVGLLS